MEPGEFRKVVFRMQGLWFRAYGVGLRAYIV